MVGPVATCVGSSGGAQPPPGPHRLPSQCESAPTANNQRKRVQKGRGKAKGHDIAGMVAREGKIKLRFDEDGGTWKAIGRHAAWWDSSIGIHTRDCCDPFHDKWKDVLPQQKAQIRERLLEWFDIDFETQDNVFLEVVDRDAMKCYRSWKNKLSAHFRKFKTEEAARADRPDSVRDDRQWGLCCERFASVAFKNKSKKNSENRGKHKYKSHHGRRSYMQHRELKGNIETLEFYSAIENWKDMHHDGENWDNEEAEQTYHMMVDELQTLLREASVGPSSSSTSGSALINELPILSKVLGTHRGHTTGVGPALSRSSRGYAQASQSTSTARHASCKAEINMLKGVLAQVMDVVRQLAPDAQLPDIPHSAPPSSSSAVEPDHDDDVADLGD